MSRHLYEKRSTVGYSMTQQEGEVAFKNGLSFFQKNSFLCPCRNRLTFFWKFKCYVTITNDYFKLLRDLSVRTPNAEF